MRKKTVIVLLSTAAFLCALIFFNWLRDNKLPNFTGKTELYVRPETTVEDVVEALSEKTISMKSLQRTLAAKNVVEYIHPGHYVVSARNSSVYVARMLNNGWQTPVPLTLSGTIRGAGSIARKIGNQLMIDSAAVHKALNDKAFLAEYGVTPKTVQALFIPDTYQMYWDADMKSVMDRQKAAYDAFWTEENIAKAASLGLTRMEVSILASIVSSESNHKPELPRIAGVYLNRLKKGMLLQADPTVAYCFDWKPGRILKRHLEVDSPYNTYKYPGLPPGPICVPTRVSLEAVLNPDFGGGNLYFCANPDFSGTHLFARTLSEHNANARAFQKELTRRQKEKQRKQSR